jgi:nitroreductase
VLQRALVAAQHAPNHKTTWPWRLLLPGRMTREVVFRVGLRLKIAKKGASAGLEDAVRQDLLAPARLVVVVQKVSDDPNRALEDYAACACAVQNLMLSLHADGYASKWSTGANLRDPEALAALGVTPDERIVAFVWAGVADIVPNPSARPADRVVVLP